MDNDTIISWSENRKLIWDDFKGTRNPMIFTENAAATDYSITLLPKTIKVNEYNKINAIALFFKATSWTITSSLVLLKHEQIHFDIAEIYARKIRKCFAEMKRNDEDDISNYIQTAKELGTKCTLYQQLYDKETSHGTIGFKQLEWEDSISKALKELNLYKYTSKIEDIKN